MLQTSEILTMLRLYVIEALKQHLDTDSQKDGMDLTVAVINTQTLECQWAGANNSLCLVRKLIISLIIENCKVETYDEISLIEIKPDKMPIAIYPIMKPF